MKSTQHRRNQEHVGPTPYHLDLWLTDGEKWHSEGFDFKVVVPEENGIDHSGQFLALADFSFTDLEGVCFRGADLSGADLRGTCLKDTDLKNADLSFADLRHADLRGADMTGADLSWAVLSDADLRGAVLFDCQFRGCTFERARYDLETRLPFDRQSASEQGLVMFL